MSGPKRDASAWSATDAVMRPVRAGARGRICKPPQAVWHLYNGLDHPTPAHLAGPLISWCARTGAARLILWGVSAMQNLLLGVAVLALTAGALWTVRPVAGKLSPLLGPQTEILAAIGVVLGTALGIGLMIAGGVFMLTVS